MPINKKMENAEIQTVERENWNADDIADESSNQMPDEIARQVLRGDESNGNPDSRDIIGGSKSIDTPQGREEAKKKSI